MLQLEHISAATRIKRAQPSGVKCLRSLEVMLLERSYMLQDMAKGSTVPSLAYIEDLVGQLSSRVLVYEQVDVVVVWHVASLPHSPEP